MILNPVIMFCGVHRIACHTNHHTLEELWAEKAFTGAINENG
jgi:hypothetical protein